jgi:hypothetical protein
MITKILWILAFILGFYYAKKHGNTAVKKIEAFYNEKKNKK